ncbi:ABC transporter ATP-binding protein [Pseudodesulfovibrio tunisiensis]|uniref:ABC transporter ATP-binding protein n=1 Tax=Pseudodesulfovibrio tunisiensis TaxID=463192 RepID=UPI001FB40F7A|nr:ABC transporter ATP-binding protein [Pseudodesulfovibrio tunisiensis]
MTDSVPLLSCRGVTKRFGKVVANKDITLEVRAGQVQALLGENGAGKSTLMSVLAGRYRPDAGEIRIKGQKVTFTCPADAMRMGIGMVYQRFMLVERLTVGENIRLSAQACGIAPREADRRMVELSERYGLNLDPSRTVASLAMGERQRAEILKLLVQDAEVLIFDEPTAVLSQPEAKGLFEIFDRLRENRRGVVFITHKMDEVEAAADYISILRRGEIIAGLAPSEIDSRRELARLMVGREFVLAVDKPDIKLGETVLKVDGFGGTGRSGKAGFADVSLEVRRGEILAVIGVAGNGQSALASAITGTSDAGTPTSGTVTFMGNTVDANRWRGAPTIAHVPEDRHRTGSIHDMTLAENFALTRLAEAGPGPWLDQEKVRKETAQAIRDFSIRATGPDDKAGSLSGGNLQKLILARELAGNPDLFVAEQPTQGLDIAAIEEIWASIVKQREKSAILLVSGDLKEVLSLADRIAVIFRGRILDIVEALDADSVARIGLLMAGGGDA